MTPNDSGSIRHAHPLVSTNTTAVNTARSSTGARPPPCGRGLNDGINGSARAHNSGTNRRDNAAARQAIVIELRKNMTDALPLVHPPPPG
ncbi:hypothetical protein JOM49_004379 [Amycolatopsis magusensis]|uniref:Uncharacterized protein n=1 Tax=Amycolatopsis magusensis TaxID=882444 RepID=A0ABS4PTU9_9PSEU|nr:hypothetical protein [Amycolatopsis magusensis]